MKISELIKYLEEFAPLYLQENYDNSGLLVGDKGAEIKGILLSLDCTEAVIEEAIKENCNLIIAHHPIIFTGLKSLTGKNYVERTVIKAIKNDISIYACHTNLDNIRLGVNKKIAEKLELKNISILSHKKEVLRKLVTFVPQSHFEKVREALFYSGAGNIGNYDSCSFNILGTGTFRGNSESKPFLGKPNELSEEKEVRIETVFESYLESKIVSALKASHPYEEVAYDIYSLENIHPNVGSGMLGDLESVIEEKDFMNLVKDKFKVPTIKHTSLIGKKIKTIAVCGGSGRFLLNNAIDKKADVFITSDFKYHDYFDVDGKLLLLDIGHYESEQFTVEIFHDLIIKKNLTFAVRLSKTNTNPISYF